MLRTPWKHKVKGMETQVNSRLDLGKAKHMESLFNGTRKVQKRSSAGEFECIKL